MDAVRPGPLGELHALERTRVRSRLWGSRRTAGNPAGPVAHGVGLNVTALDYQDVVIFGLVCPRPVPDVGDVAAHLYDALAEHMRAAADDLGS